MEEKRLGGVRGGQKEHGGCYREEHEAEKGKRWNAEFFRVLYLMMFVSLLSATIELRSRHPPPISSFQVRVQTDNFALLVFYIAKLKEYWYQPP